MFLYADFLNCHSVHISNLSLPGCGASLNLKSHQRRTNYLYLEIDIKIMQKKVPPTTPFLSSLQNKMNGGPQIGIYPTVQCYSADPGPS